MKYLDSKTIQVTKKANRSVGMIALPLAFLIHISTLATTKNSQQILTTPTLWQEISPRKNSIKFLFETQLDNTPYIFYEVVFRTPSGKIDSKQISIVQFEPKAQKIKIVFSDVEIWGLNDLSEMPSLNDLKVRQGLELAYLRYLKSEMKRQGKSYKKFAERHLKSESAESSKWAFRQIPSDD